MAVTTNKRTAESKKPKESSSSDSEQEDTVVVEERQQNKKPKIDAVADADRASSASSEDGNNGETNSAAETKATTESKANNNESEPMDVVVEEKKESVPTLEAHAAKSPEEIQAAYKAQMAKLREERKKGKTAAFTNAMKSGFTTALEQVKLAHTLGAQNQELYNDYIQMIVQQIKWKKFESVAKSASVTGKIQNLPKNSEAVVFFQPVIPRTWIAEQAKAGRFSGDFPTINPPVGEVLPKLSKNHNTKTPDIQRRDCAYKWMEGIQVCCSSFTLFVSSSDMHNIQSLIDERVASMNTFLPGAPLQIYPMIISKGDTIVLTVESYKVEKLSFTVGDTIGFLKKIVPEANLEPVTEGMSTDKLNRISPEQRAVISAIQDKWAKYIEREELLGHLHRLEIKAIGQDEKTVISRFQPSGDAQNSECTNALGFEKLADNKQAAIDALFGNTWMSAFNGLVAKNDKCIIVGDRAEVKASVPFGHEEKYLLRGEHTTPDAVLFTGQSPMEDDLVEFMPGKITTVASDDTIMKCTVESPIELTESDKSKPDNQKPLVPFKQDVVVTAMGPASIHCMKVNMAKMVESWIPGMPPPVIKDHLPVLWENLAFACQVSGVGSSRVSMRPASNPRTGQTPGIGALDPVEADREIGKMAEEAIHLAFLLKTKGAEIPEGLTEESVTQKIRKLWTRMESAIKPLRMVSSSSGSDGSASESFKETLLQSIDTSYVGSIIPAGRPEIRMLPEQTFHAPLTKVYWKMPMLLPVTLDNHKHTYPELYPTNKAGSIIAVTNRSIIYGAGRKQPNLKEATNTGTPTSCGTAAYAPGAKLPGKGYFMLFDRPEGVEYVVCDRRTALEYLANAERLIAMIGEALMANDCELAKKTYNGALLVGMATSITSSPDSRLMVDTEKGRMPVQDLVNPKSDNYLDKSDFPSDQQLKPCIRYEVMAFIMRFFWHAAKCDLWEYYKLFRMCRKNPDSEDSDAPLFGDVFAFKVDSYDPFVIATWFTNKTVSSDWQKMHRKFGNDPDAKVTDGASLPDTMTSSTTGSRKSGVDFAKMLYPALPWGHPGQPATELVALK